VLTVDQQSSDGSVLLQFIRNFPVFAGVKSRGEVFFYNPMPPHVLMDLVVFPPGHGSSVTDL
jgi:hypothetical protein